jgi:hypothetical protein
LRYDEWLEQHQQKHKSILFKLSGRKRDEIIAYFDYENMKVQEYDFCPLYAQDQKCHDMDHLNCYFCACPHFVFYDRGLKRVGQRVYYSECAINAKEGKLFMVRNALHQDCSACHLPHTLRYIRKHFDEKGS